MSVNPAYGIASREAYEAAVARLREASSAYYNAEALLMGDAEWDALAAEAAAAELAHPEWLSPDSPTGKVAGGVGVAGTIRHEPPMLSLDNVYDHAELVAWVTRVERALGHPVTAGYTVEPKLDGLAVAARYVDGRLDRLATRGDGSTGEDVTHAVSRIGGLPAQLAEPVTVEVRGEVFFRESDFESANEGRVASGKPAFAAPRSAAAGCLRAETLNHDALLSFAAYSVMGIDAPTHMEAMSRMRMLGITAADVTACTDTTAVLTRIAEIGTGRALLGYGVDGAVVKANAAADRDTVGSGSRAPRWAIAYKGPEFPADVAVSRLVEVLWQVGRTGVITPRGRIEPVTVGGVEIAYATLHNVGDLTRKGFMLGDKVTIRRAGEVIPRIEAPLVDQRTGEETPIQEPAVCPRCGGDLDTTEARWRCRRGRACGLRESIRYGVSRDCLDIEGMGDALVTQLVDRGLVADLADIFTLTREQLLGLDRMGGTSVDKLLDQIERAKSQPLSRVFCALGVLQTGRSMSRRLARHFTRMDALVAATVADLEAVDGIGPTRAAVIAEELVELAPVIVKLQTAGVNLVEPVTAASASAATNDEDGATPDNRLPFTGLTVVVSGTVPGLSRNEANEAVERLGGSSSGSVSKKTNLLIAGDGAGSKVAKAESLGVRVMSADEFAALLADI
ncbi:NAD-dependent DNA ligase LigA [Dactylosporangium sp. CA-152071]|uniref:NAD-dependent DNA ligase LigA n=1 Tax=Dactylosporangium sp. CA-152071 TaxID=3239933 RepID=UPI003D8AD8F4